QRGWAFLESDNLKAALLDLSYAAEHGSRDPWLYINLGAAFFQKGEPEKALKANEKAIALEDEQIKPSVYFQRGLILLTIGQTKEAQNAYEEGLIWAEKLLDVQALDDGIQELRDVDANKRVREIANQIRQKIAETRQRIAPRAKPHQDRCQRVKV